MNVQSNTTVKPAPTTSPDDALLKMVEEAAGEARAIHNALYLLLSDLDWGFSEKRAIATDKGSVTLIFQKHGIDAKLWLAGEAWSKAADIVEQLNVIVSKVEGVQA